MVNKLIILNMHLYILLVFYFVPATKEIINAEDCCNNHPNLEVVFLAKMMIQK